MPPNSAGRLAHPASGREASSAAVRQAFQRTTRPKVPPKREELSHQGTSREKSGRPAARFGHEPWQAHARSPNRTGNSGTCSASAPARQTMTWCPRIRKRGVTLVAYGSEITTGNHARLTARRRCACDACSRGSRSPFELVWAKWLARSMWCEDISQSDHGRRETEKRCFRGAESQMRGSGARFRFKVRSAGQLRMHRAILLRKRNCGIPPETSWRRTKRWNGWP